MFPFRYPRHCNYYIIARIYYKCIHRSWWIFIGFIPITGPLIVIIFIIPFFWFIIGMGYLTSAYAINKGYGRDIISHRLVTSCFISWITNLYLSTPACLRRQYFAERIKRHGQCVHRRLWCSPHICKKWIWPVFNGRVYCCQRKVVSDEHGCICCPWRVGIRAGRWISIVWHLFKNVEDSNNRKTAGWKHVSGRTDDFRIILPRNKCAYWWNYKRPPHRI